MNSLLTLAKDLEQKSKAQQQSTGEMLKAAFSEHEVCQSGTERKREENQRRHPRPRAGYERGHAVEPPERDAYGRADMADHHDGVRTAVRQPERGVVVSGSLIASNLAEIDRQNAALSKLNAKTWGVTCTEDSNGRFLVLPKGTAVDRTQSWTVGNGRSKQNALRLVKE